jgi:hypothetical protein
MNIPVDVSHLSLTEYFAPMILGINSYVLTNTGDSSEEDAPMVHLNEQLFK